VQKEVCVVHTVGAHTNSVHNTLQFLQRGMTGCASWEEQWRAESWINSATRKL
jgi:hypothetical protein